MRLKGLEPARIAAREPKSRMSTNSITGAYERRENPHRCFLLNVADKILPVFLLQE